MATTKKSGTAKRAKAGEAKQAPFDLRAHDWHSLDYVQEWISRDVTRDDERRPVIRRMLALLPFNAAMPLEVLDVGAGYGIFASEVLRAFPRARVTLQDYSWPMLAQARRRLAAFAGRTRYVQGDLTRPSWTTAAGGPFDVAVSSLAIHNLQNPALIAACYRAIGGVLKRGGYFLDYDHFKYAGGAGQHLAMIKRGGFGPVDCVWSEGPSAVVRARKAA